MLIQIQKWGNSLAIRIPKSFTKEINIDQGSFLELSLVEGKLVVTPVLEKEYSLDALLAQIKEENIHTGIDTGESVGKEIW